MVEDVEVVFLLLQSFYAVVGLSFHINRKIRRQSIVMAVSVPERERGGEGGRERKIKMSTSIHNRHTHTHNDSKIIKVFEKKKQSV